jgi:hypothetical protein
MTRIEIVNHLILVGARCAQLECIGVYRRIHATYADHEHANDTGTVRCKGLGQLYSEFCQESFSLNVQSGG